MAFDLSGRRSLSAMGNLPSGLKWMARPKGSGLDKRQATIQLCIRAGAHSCVWWLVVLPHVGTVSVEPTGFIRAIVCHVVCVAEGEQLVRVALIFRGLGHRLSDEEQQHYASLSHLIHVYFQVHRPLVVSGVPCFVC